MRYLIVLIFFLINIEAGKSQQNLEIGLTAGLAYYRGDLNENDFLGKLLRSNGGGFLKINLRPQIVLKGQITIGKLAGDDQYTKNKDIRGAYFEGTYYSFAFTGEYLPLRKSRYERGGFQGSWSPFVTMGIEYLRFVDKVKCRYCTTNLPETGDKNSFISIPVGVGVRFDYHPKFSYGAEFLWHATFSDKLDGISLLGDSTNNDWMLTANIFVSYFFGEIQPDLRLNVD